jgi:PHD/YefM family antitoxin component YafN of YafNO toxin-antitoxin module
MYILFSVLKNKGANTYNVFRETNYLLKSPKNREILLRSLQDARDGKVLSKELLEV